MIGIGRTYVVTNTQANLNKYKRKLKGRPRKDNTKTRKIIGTGHNKDIKAHAA